MKNLRLEVILREVKDYFHLLYQNQLQKIVLYGSQAREDGREDSDIDLLVILSGVVDPYQEIDRTSQFIPRLALIIMWLFPVILYLRQSSRAEIIPSFTIYGAKGSCYERGVDW